MLPLARLDPAAMAGMALACWTPPTCRPRSTSFVAERAEGIPFLVEEILAGLIGEGALTERDGSWNASDLTGSAIPATFADAVRRRLDAWTRTPATSSARPRCSAAGSTGRCSARSPAWPARPW